MREVAKITVWAKRSDPLTLSAIRRAGFNTVKAYLQSLIDEGNIGAKKLRHATIPAGLPDVAFGDLDLNQIVLICDTLDDVPSEIDGILTSN